MNYSIIFKIIGWVIQLEGIFFLPPAVTGLIFGEYNDAFVYLILGACGILLGGLIRLHKSPKTTFFAREGFVAVALSFLPLTAAVTLTGVALYSQDIANGSGLSFTDEFCFSDGEARQPHTK